MQLIITAEHFKLTPENREHLEFMLGKLRDLVCDKSNIRLFLKWNSNEIEATVVIHSRHEDLSYSARGADLIKLVASVQSHLIRRVITQKEKKLDRRRRRTRIEEVA